MKKPTEKFLSNQEAADLGGPDPADDRPLLPVRPDQAIAINTGPRPIYRIRGSDFRAHVQEWVRED